MLSIATSRGPVVFLLEPEVEKRIMIETGMRKKILDILYREPKTVSQLARELEVSHTTVAHHLLRMLEQNEVEIVKDIVEKNLPQEKYYRAMARRVKIKAPSAELGKGMDSFLNNLSNVILIGLFKLKEIYQDQMPPLENIEELEGVLNGSIFYTSLTIASIMPYLLEFSSKVSEEHSEKLSEAFEDFLHNLAEGKKPVRPMVEKLHALGLKTIDEIDERVKEYYIL